MSNEKPSRKWGEWYEDSSGNKVKDFPLHKGQIEVLNSTARFTAAIAGTGGGKTSLIPLWLMRQIQKNQKGKFICVSPNFKMLRRSLLKEIQESFEGLPEFQGDFIEHKSEYHCPSGAMLYFYSATEPDSIQAVHADGAVIDECGLVKSDVFRIVRQRTNKNAASVLMTSTPYNFGWLYHDIYLKAKACDPDYKVVHFVSTDNPTYSVEEFEAERKRLPDWRFRMMYLGQFARPDSCIYPGMSDCLIDATELPRVKPSQYFGGLDFGFNDPSCALSGFIHEGCLYLIYEKYERGKTIDEFAQGLPNKVMTADGASQVHWTCDSSRPDAIKQLRKLGFVAHRCKKYAGSVQDNIDNVNALIRTGKLKILKGNVSALLQEADLYCYSQNPDKEGEYTDKPIDANNHACDALAYLVRTLKKRRLLAD